MGETSATEATRQAHDETPITFDEAVSLTSPGTALRHALDMIIAGRLGALICVGDSEAVLAAGNDGFPLNISFTANRLFELSKMDGAIVIDRDFTQILRANFHLNPDPSLPTSETGMRHRTAARVSLLTHAMVISVSERRQVVTVYVDGKAFQLRPVSELMTSANQLLVTLQNTRATLERGLLRLTSLEMDNFVTLADVTQMLLQFELLVKTDASLRGIIAQLGKEGTTVEMQRAEFSRDLDDEYTLLVRDYAQDSSPEAAKAIRTRLSELASRRALTPSAVGEALGLEQRREDSVVAPLGLRTLSRVSVVREGMADKIVDEYGSLQELLDDMEQNPERLDDIGVNNPSILADSLYRMWGKRE
ncbi:MAG: DNA integrity scanning protein DisA [Olsenella sp.]|nr:DNA integrity scanning protein DisA [Olsenella sp.]